MARLWRSVFILILCLSAVIGLRLYLTKQVELARSGTPDAPTVEATTR